MKSDLVNGKQCENSTNNWQKLGISPISDKSATIHRGAVIILHMTFCSFTKAVHAELSQMSSFLGGRDRTMRSNRRFKKQDMEKVNS